MEWENKGIKITGKTLNNLRFADDIALIAKNFNEMVEMVGELKRVSEEYGLVMNLSKSKFMSNREGPNNIWLEGAKISRVQEYKYLGQTTKFDNNMEGIIRERIANAWKAFWAHKFIFKNKIKLSLKMKVLESCVVPVLTYGSQTWALTQRQIQRLKNTHNSMLRSILGIRLKDKINIKTIKAKTGAKSIGYKIKKLKLKYAGHLARGDPEKWSYRCTMWDPKYQKRKRGRPATRWMDEILRYLGPCWAQTARERERWRKVTETYAQRWAD